MNQRSINFNRVLFALLLCVGVIMISCEEIQPIAVTSVSLNSTSMELVEGTTQTLVATVSPSNAENQKVIWSSNNSSVATVTDGVVTAIKAGTATITVKTDDGNKTATCSVIVVAKEIPVTSVSLDQTEIELLEGDELTLTATVKPDNATNKNVTWSSSNSSVATVTDGVVTAIKAGTATITVKTDDGAKTATCSVIVVAKEIPVTSVSLDQTEIELLEGDELTLTATVKPDNATNKNVTWTSSNESVATVDNGKITAVKAGSSMITVTTEDGNKSTTCEVTVLHVQSNDVIVFADDIMKELCITAFDTNGDGELSYTEAAEVKSLIYMTLTKKTFKSFDEFQYFTSVTAIPDRYFRGVSIKSIVLPYRLKSIGSYAFQECSSLQSINIPYSVTSIGSSAFKGCSSLQSINIPESVTFIDNSTFSDCSSLQSIDIPESVKTIGNYVFKGCSSLRNIDIPDSVPCIGNEVFKGCSSLQSIDIPESVTSIGSYAFQECSSLQSIDIPESVTSIGESAFSDCSSLQSIDIPESVTSIGNRAFEKCSSLQSINIPESVTFINNATFWECSSLQSIDIPKSVTSIGESAFYYCSSLQSIDIPESVTSIGDEVFKWCSSLQSIDIPDSVPCIGNEVFKGCSSLQSIDIPDSVKSIGNWAFEKCSSLQSINIPESVKSIGNSAFEKCSSLQSINIPESVKSIGNSALEKCSSLQSINIPESVTYIGESAFYDCSSLQKIYVKSQDCPELAKDGSNRYLMFYNNAPSRKIYVPYKVLDTYKKAEGWSTYADNIVGYDYENNKVVE